MSRMTLAQIEDSVAELDLADQVRLLQYLTPRIAGAVLDRSDTTTSKPVDESADDPAWQRYRELAQRLADTSVPGAPSMLDELIAMRR